MTVPGSFDRLVELVPGERAVAVRNVTNTLTFFDAHFPRHPVLPGVLLLETMAAVGMQAVQDTGLRLAGVSGVRYRHFVGPGDQVRVTAEVTGRDEHGITVRATARVEDRVVASARRLTLVPADQQQKGTR